MFPNTHDTLPLPPHPQLAQYKKLAKELLRAKRSEEPEAIRAWVFRWLNALERLTKPYDPSSALSPAYKLTNWTSEITTYAHQILGADETQCSNLGAAQFVIARCHGFGSWSRFTEHLDRLAHVTSAEASFEAAVDAIISGKEKLLTSLLTADPNLVKARSAREHKATLLHYVAANGVENYRQRSPPNAAAILEILLKAGAAVDAEANIYGGGATTLGLVATSGHPQQAGVQITLMQMLLEAGSKVQGGLVEACLTNNQPAAARFLAHRVAPISLQSAAGLGQLEVVKKLLDQRQPTTIQEPAEVFRPQLEQGLLWAATYGHQDVIEYLISEGVSIRCQDNWGQSALHHAAMRANQKVAQLLIEWQAPLELRNTYGGTPLGQALWSATNSTDQAAFLPVIQTLLEAGSAPEPFSEGLAPSIKNLLARFGSGSVK